MANAADNFQWNADNVFQYGNDLNPLAMQVGAGADGVRDTLAQKRDDYLKPYYNDYRTAGAAAGARVAQDDASLFGDQGFQNYVKTGQTSFQPAQPAAQAAPQNQTVAQQWTSQAQAPAIGQAPQTTPSAEDPRRSTLYDALMKRGLASVNPDINDPSIRPQVDAYSAAQERARRDYLDSAAEAGGPSINLRGEQRMAAERMGQNVGTFKANLLGQELKARRADTMEALQTAMAMNDKDMAAQLQEKLANLDAMLKEQGFTIQDKEVNQDLSKTLMQNDQFMRQLGLNEWDRANYWDALKSGYLG